MPSLEEIQDFMIQLGFRPLQDSSFDWLSESNEIKVADARPDNFVKMSEGVVPIDLIVGLNDPH